MKLVLLICVLQYSYGQSILKDKNGINMYKPQGFNGKRNFTRMFVSLRNKEEKDGEPLQKPINRKSDNIGVQSINYNNLYENKEDTDTYEFHQSANHLDDNIKFGTKTHNDDKIHIEMKSSKETNINKDCLGHYEYGYAYPGNDINDNINIKTETPKDCQEICKTYPKCKGWEWGHEGNNCWIKYALKNRVSSDHFVVVGNRDACPVEKETSCQFGKGINFRGKFNKTRSGALCDKWTIDQNQKHFNVFEMKDFGLGDHNFCRNPRNLRKGTWCYTHNGTETELCNLKHCVNYKLMPPRVACSGVWRYIENVQDCKAAAETMRLKFVENFKGDNSGCSYTTNRKSLRITYFHDILPNPEDRNNLHGTRHSYLCSFINTGDMFTKTVETIENTTGYIGSSNDSNAVRRSRDKDINWLLNLLIPIIKYNNEQNDSTLINLLTALVSEPLQENKLELIKVIVPLLKQKNINKSVHIINALLNLLKDIFEQDNESKLKVNKSNLIHFPENVRKNYSIKNNLMDNLAEFGRTNEKHNIFNKMFASANHEFLLGHLQKLSSAVGNNFYLLIIILGGVCIILVVLIFISASKIYKWWARNQTHYDIGDIKVEPKEKNTVNLKPRLSLQ